MERETNIEDYARRKIKKAGGRMLKWVSPGVRGVPDNIVFWPEGRVHFIEFKSARGRLHPSQIAMRRFLIKMWCLCPVLCEREDVDHYVEIYQPKELSKKGC